MSLTGSDWDVMVTEPADNPDLGPFPLLGLVLLRLTGVEVHGGDLALSLNGWSEIFVESALPFRLDRLNLRRTNHSMAGSRARGSWLLARGGHRWPDVPDRRERGATAFSLMAAAEDWPASPWIEPWSRAS